jgi:hypothetical protein
MIETKINNIKCPEFIKRIDWRLLREQKRYLLELSSPLIGIFTEKEYNAFEGIINLLDSIQDYAVDECGIDENDVFNFEQIE